jgi:hypothetical protein
MEFKYLAYSSLFVFALCVIAIYIMGLFCRKKDVSIIQFLFLLKGFSFTGVKYIDDKYVKVFTIFNSLFFLSFICFMCFLFLMST